MKIRYNRGKITIYFVALNAQTNYDGITSLLTKSLRRGGVGLKCFNS